MVGVVIASHANLCEGLVNAVSLIAGKQEQVETIGLFHEDGIEQFKQKVFDAIERVDTGDGVICFVDFIGGSPANAMMEYSREHDLRCVVGVNMPMLLEMFLSREGKTPAELEAMCIETGRNNIDSLKNIMSGFSMGDEQEPEDF